MTKVPLSKSNSNSPKRPYNSSARERQAEETRQHILNAARSLFLKNGYASTTLDAIAEEAEVSPKTVAAGFGSKRGLLADLLSPATFGLRYQELLEQLQTDANPQQRFAIVAQMTRHIYEALAPEFDLLRGAATIAQELADIAQQVEARRWQKQTLLITYLADQGLLRLDIPSEEVTDELWTLTSYDVYRMLVVERNWKPEHYEAWLIQILSQRLLEPRLPPALVKEGKNNSPTG